MSSFLTSDLNQDLKSEVTPPLNGAQMSLAAGFAFCLYEMHYIYIYTIIIIKRYLCNICFSCYIHKES